MNPVNKALVVASLASVSSLAQAIDIQIGSSTIDVGQADTLVSLTSSLGSCPGGSSPSAETCWANSVLDPDATYFAKSEKVTYYQTDTANLYAFALVGDPGYYIIKNATYWALFQNLASTDWGVFSTALLPGGMNLGGTGELTISHVTSFNGTTSVPEPATLGMYLLGLLGVGFAARRRQAA
jgi:hypothetical protein